MPYPDRFYPVVDSVAWVARLALLGVGTIQLRAKNLGDGDALQTVTDALVRLFDRPEPWVRSARNRGMSLVATVGPLRRLLAQPALR